MAEHAMYFADDKARRIYLAKSIISKVFVYLFLTIFALFMLAPFVLMVTGSFVHYEHFDNFSNYADFKELGFANWGFANYKEVIVPDTNVNNLIFTVLGIAIIGSGLGFVYKNGKKDETK